MLQGRRIWAKKPSFVHSLLRQIPSLLVAYSSRTNPIEIVNLTPIPPPLANPTSVCSFRLSPTRPETPRDQLETQIPKTKPHGRRQEGNWVAGWSTHRAFDRLSIGLSGARNFSTTTSTNWETIQSAMLERGGSIVDIGGDPAMAKFVPSTTARRVGFKRGRMPSPPRTNDLGWSDLGAQKLVMKQSPQEKKLEAQVRILKLKIKRIQKRSREGLKHWETLEKDILDVLGLGEITHEDSSLSSGGKVRGRASPHDSTSVTTHTQKFSRKTTVTLDAETTKLVPQVFNLQEMPAAVDVFYEDLKLTPEPDSPYAPLQYQMDPKLLLSRQTLRDGSINKYWSHQLYRRQGKPVAVHYCETFEEAEKVARIFLGDKVVGFDMEWLSFQPTPALKSPRTHASLIQIANESDIALFHVSLFERSDKKLIPPSLQKIIKSKNILKVGVSIAGDAKRIYTYHNILPQGLFELSDFENLLLTAEVGEGRIPRRLIALSKLVEQYLELPMRKGWVRLSDWSKPLSHPQIRYAASDAYAGLRLFDALQRKRKELRPSPPLPACRVLVETLEESQSTVTKTQRVSRKLITEPEETIDTTLEVVAETLETP